MYLLIDWNGTVRVTASDQEVIDFLAADPENKAYGFMGWQVELEDDGPVNTPAEGVSDEPAQPEE